MKERIRIVAAALLVLAAIVAFLYNLFLQREILYLSSLIAVCGTVLILVKEILRYKRKNKFM